MDSGQLFMCIVLYVMSAVYMALLYWYRLAKRRHHTLAFIGAIGPSATATGLLDTDSPVPGTIMAIFLLLALIAMIIGIYQHATQIRATFGRPSTDEPTSLDKH